MREFGSPGEQFAQVRQRAAHGFRARIECLLHAREIVPIDVMHLRLEENVRMPGPCRFKGEAVRSAEFRVEYFHNII